MSQIKRSSYFRKNLLSYFIIFFIPIVLFIGLFQFQFNKILEQELINNNVLQLTTLEEILTNEFRQINEVICHTILSRNLTPVDIKDGPTEPRERIRVLKEYKSLNPFIDEILLYYYDDQYIYSSAGSYDAYDSFASVYKFEDWSSDEIIEQMENTQSIYIRPKDVVQIIYEQDTRNYTSLLYGLSYDGFSYYGSLMFMLNDTSIIEKITTAYPSNLNSTFILDSQNNLVTYQSNNDSINLTTYKDYLNALTSDEPSKILHIDKDDYLITYVKSDTFDWQYYNFTPVDKALSLAFDTQKQFIYMVIILLFIGVVIISMLMSLNYGPIKKLLKLSDEVLTDTEETQHNELDHIEGAIKYLSNKNTVLKESIIDSTHASKEYLIGQLISGQTLKKEYLNSDTLKIVMNPMMTNYFIMIVHIVQKESLWSDMKTEFTSDIEGYSSDGYSLLCKESLVSNMVTIVGLTTKSTNTLIHSYIQNLHEKLIDTWKSDITIGISAIYTSLDELPKAYMNASTAIDYRLMIGAGSMIPYDEIVTYIKDETLYPYNDLERFKLSIKRGNAEDVDIILNNIILQFKTKRIPIFIARSICYEIINNVVRHYEELGQEHEELFKKYPDSITMSRYESIHKIIDLVRLISYDVCTYLNDSYDDDNIIFARNVENYIEEYYMDPDFSLQSMADYFGKQASNLSSFYKEHTGDNILEIVTKHRMIAASELLMTSKIPINQICVRIGYINVSSFIRRFKQYYGITPGQYRSSNS